MNSWVYRFGYTLPSDLPVPSALASTGLRVVTVQVPSPTQLAPLRLYRSEAPLEARACDSGVDAAAGHLGSNNNNNNIDFRMDLV